MAQAKAGARALNCSVSYGAVVAALGVWLTTGVALADCQQSGAAVTCTGGDPNGFGNGTQTGFTVNVAPGASVAGIAPGTFWLNNNNTIVNNGSITGVGNVAVAIRAGDNNHITNHGSIVTEGFGIAIAAGNTIINNGTISVSHTGIFELLFGGGNVVMNNGTITGFTGIQLDSNAVITNNGTIAGADESEGIFLLDNNQVTNNGTIRAGDYTGGANTPSGIQAGSGNTILNNGLIIVGKDGHSLSLGQNNTITNFGTLDGRLSLWFDPGNVITNSGLITISNAGTGFFPHGVNGTFTQTAAGILALRVNATGAHDGLAVTGTANLGGTLRATIQPGLYGAQTVYTNVITATDPIVTQFAQTAASSPFFTAAATYNANSVDLALTRVAFNAVPGLTQNQTAVGSALEVGYSPGLTGAAATFYGNLLAGTGPVPFDALSGEGVSGAQQAAFSASDMFLNVLQGQTWFGTPGPNSATSTMQPLAYAARAEHPAFKTAAPAPQAWRAWTAGFGGRQSLDGEAGIGSATLSHRTVGLAAGIDHWLAPGVRVGIAAGGSNSDFSVPGRSTSGDLAATHVGAYGAARAGAFYASGVVSYSRLENDTTRSIAVGGITETARGSFASDLFGGRFELGARTAFDHVAVTPFAAVQFALLHQGGYMETSAGAAGAPGTFGLSYAAKTTSSVPASVGIQIDTSLPLQNGTLWSPFLRAAWVHEFSPDREVTAGFTAVPGTAFTVDGPRAARDTVKVDLGSNLAVTRSMALFARFTGGFSTRSESYAANGGVRVSW